MADWIPVRDGLPEECKSVLIIVSGRPCPNIKLIDAYEFGNYSVEEGWIVEDYPAWMNPAVTHWMPLPQPPGENGKEEPL